MSDTLSGIFISRRLPHFAKLIQYNIVTVFGILTISIVSLEKAYSVIRKPFYHQCLGIFLTCSFPVYAIIYTV